MLLAAASPALAQIGQTGVIAGSVADSSGGVLPGVTVTITSPALIGPPRTATTEGDGTFRFPALTPGVYTVSVELQGFKPVKRENVTVRLGETSSLKISLEVGSLQETVTVSGESPVIDIKSSSSQKNLSSEALENVPFSSRFGPAAMAMSAGVNPDTSNLSAYGSGGTSSNAYMLDGVDVSDTDAGTIWVFAGYNWIQEVQVVSLGAAAEYGGFSGAASNSLFRSGSNQFHGLGEFLFQNQKLTGSNTTPAILAQNKDLTPGKTGASPDFTAQIGGPIARDKVWFFTSFQYFNPRSTPAGYPPVNPSTDQPWTPSMGGPAERLEKSPRFLFKPTWQINQKDKLTGFIEAERYDVDGRGAWGNVSTEATRKETSAGAAWNANWTRILSSSSVFDVKYSGYWGYYYNDQYNGDKMGWYDGDTDFYSVNSYYWYHADRTRHQLNASVSKYASGFAGTHNLKFGLEYERGFARDTDGYPGGGYIYALSGVPYGAYLIEPYTREAKNNRVSLYAQDAWSVTPRFTLNIGVRGDIDRGFNPGLNQTVFKANGIAPRLGFAWDVSGNGKTVVRGHYGDFYDGMKSSYYWSVDPRQPPWYWVNVDPETLQPLWTPTSEDIAKVKANRFMDPAGIRLPFVRQATVGMEHELVPGFSVGATYIYRRNKNLIDDVLYMPDGLNAMFTASTYTDPGPDGTIGTADDGTNAITMYKQNTKLYPTLDNQYMITNPPGAYRQYHALELVAAKKLADRWMVSGSWVMSRILGNNNNTSNSGKSTTYDDPNVDPRYQPFMNGHLTRDNTNLVKLSGLYQGPAGINLSGYFYYLTGDAITTLTRPASKYWGSGQKRLDIMMQPRGSQRLDGQPNLDFKVEKLFKFGPANSLAGALEIFNLFNNGAINDRTMREGSSYYNPLGLVEPRRARVSLVYKF
jgi:hypothetical protein